MPNDLDSAVKRYRVDRRSPAVSGDRCTFLVETEADAVFVRHRVIEWPRDLEMTRVGDTDLWLLEIGLPPGSRVEYQFERRRGPQWERFNDPGNPRIGRSPVGNSSVAWGSGYAPPPWALESGSPAGSMEDLVVPSRAQARENTVRLYRPASFRTGRPYPVLIVHDGGDFLAYASMRTVLDNLIASRVIPELVVAFLVPGERLREYANDAEHDRWLTTELIPALRSRVTLGSVSLMGSSFGAVASLSSAVRHPHAFGGLLLLSGSFVFTEDGETHSEDASFDPVVRFVNAYRARPSRVCDRMFLSCGRYEDLVVHNRAMVPVFEQTGMQVRYVESLDGHNWEGWRDRLRDGLMWLYPMR